MKSFFLTAILLFTLALASTEVMAQNGSTEGRSIIASSQKEKCSSGTTHAMNECMLKEYKVIDQKMNAALKKLYEILVDSRGIRESQAAWLKFRDAECSDNVLQTSRTENSMYDYAKSSCLIKATEERLNKIRWHLAQDCNGCPARK